MIKSINTEGNPILTRPCVMVTPITAGTDSLTDALTSVEPRKMDKKDARNDFGSTEEIIQFWGSETHDLVVDLIDTAVFHKKTCLGLSANQIWDKVSPCPAVFIMLWPVMIEGKPTAVWRDFINPTVIASGKKSMVKEVCMSIPGDRRKVRRRANSSITYQTLRSPKIRDDKIYGRLGGPWAQILQHEYDHLQGKLI